MEQSSLPDKYSLVDTYLISMLRDLRPMTKHLQIVYFGFVYFFDKETLDMLIEAADDHIVDAASNGRKGLLRFRKLPEEPTIEVGYVLYNGSKFPYMITDIQDGFQRYFFQKADRGNKFFPADLKYPF